MCWWLNAATSRMCRDCSMPLPNTSPDMSPMPATVKSCVLGVDAELAEVPLHAFPGAARRDAHLLVVVAGRAAGGEGVAEPEAARRGDGVGDVGETGGALVGRHDQVGIVAVAPHDAPAAGRSAPSTMLSVRSSSAPMKSGRPQCLRAGSHRAARPPAAARHEAALRADRHDQRVLDVLRLHQARALRCGSPRAGRTSGCRRARPGPCAGARPRPAASRRRSRSAAAAAAGRGCFAGRA